MFGVRYNGMTASNGSRTVEIASSLKDVSNLCETLEMLLI